MLHLSLQPSSWRNHSHKEVFITSYKPAPPSLRNLPTCSWIQVLRLIMSNDASDIKEQWISRIYNTKLILTRAELLGKDPHSSCRLSPSTVPLTHSSIFKSPHCKFFTLSWIYKNSPRCIAYVLCCWSDKPYNPRTTFWQWGVRTKCPRRTLESLLPSSGMFTGTFLDAVWENGHYENIACADTCKTWKNTLPLQSPHTTMEQQYVTNNTHCKNICTD